ncbi:SDR family oxidoreductase [Sphingobium sp.]|uniref:SDR family oxidoreductase n=1 Tax=Sphingobium sp. TaxID=1912891 RepID=UPI0035C75A45
MGVVVVTGAFGALGRSVVALLAERGHVIAAVDLGPAPVNYPYGLALGGVDLTDADAVAGAFARIAGQHGKIDGLVNIAGGFMWCMVADTAPEDWDRMYRMNLLSAALCCRQVIGHLADKGSAIVNIGAAAARAPTAGMAPYAASKAAVMALTESLANELRPRTRVNAILPTIIDTPANRADMPDADSSEWVQPFDLAKVVALLLSPEAAAITGEGIKVSLGAQS